MIQVQSLLKVSDNSGAKTVKCLKILGGFKKQYAKLGDVVIVSVQQLRNRSKKTSKVKKKEIYKALIIRAKGSNAQNIGLKKSFYKNAVTLLNKQGNPVGTWILGPISNIFKRKKFQKFINISKGLI